MLSSGLDKSFYERSVAKIHLFFIFLLWVHIPEALQNWDGYLHFLCRALKQPSEELMRLDGAALLRPGGICPLIVQVHVSCPLGSSIPKTQLLKN